MAPWEEPIVDLGHLQFHQSTVSQDVAAGNAVTERTRDLVASQADNHSYAENSTPSQRGSNQDTDLDGFALNRQDQVSALINYMRDGSFAMDASVLDRSCSPTAHKQLYVDCSGFRESQADRGFRERHATILRRLPPDEGSRTNMSWSEVLLEEIDQAKSQPQEPRFNIPESVYQQIRTRLQSGTEKSLLPDKYTADLDILLSRDTFEHLIEQYFDHFHHLHPFVDRSLLSIPVWGWSLCIGVAAIGSRYLSLPELTDFGEQLCSALHELLLREASLPISHRLGLRHG